MKDLTIIFVLLILTSVFHTFLQNSSTKGGNFAVLLGTDIEMTCVPPKEAVGFPLVQDERFYVWTNEEGREIVNPRMTISKYGNLLIKKAQEGDSGEYHCKYRMATMSHEGTRSKIFVHKLIVYELSGHKFESLVSFDVTQYGSEPTITTIRNLLRDRVCGEFCIPGSVSSNKCEVAENERQVCEMSIVYEAVQSPMTVTCREACVREAMVEKLKQAQKNLESYLLAASKDSTSRLSPEMQSIDTKHVITCRAGYRLVQSNLDHCFPCYPGTYSEPEKLSCESCPLGFFQEKYGSHECDQCPDNKATETTGSRSRDDCRPAADTGVLKAIKEGIVSLFKG